MKCSSNKCMTITKEDMLNVWDYMMDWEHQMLHYDTDIIPHTGEKLISQLKPIYTEITQKELNMELEDKFDLGVVLEELQDDVSIEEAITIYENLTTLLFYTTELIFKYDGLNKCLK